MLSSREILLARHRAVEPRLDAMRVAVLAAGTRAVRQPVLLNALRTLWRELVVPCRPAWVAFAAVWVVLLVVNGAGRSAGHEVRPTASEMAMTIASWREQRRLLAELTSPAAPPSMNKPATNRMPDHSFFRFQRATADRAC